MTTCWSIIYDVQAGNWQLKFRIFFYQALSVLENNHRYVERAKNQSKPKPITLKQKKQKQNDPLL